MFVTCLRLVISCVVLIFLALIYWSFVIQEERLAAIQSTLIELKKKIENEPAKETQVRSLQPDASFKNLLIEDPYFLKTLPALLGKDFVPHGVLRQGTIGAPEHLHPFSQWAQVASWTSYCQGSAGTLQVGFYESLALDFALKIEERPTESKDKIAFWVYLRPGLFWQPLEARHFPQDLALSSHFFRKYPVTAHDFQFYWEALTNPHVDVAEAVTLRFLLRDIEEVKAVDDLTFIVTARLHEFEGTYRLPYSTRFYVAGLKPLARFVYQYRPDGSKIAPDDMEPGFYGRSTVWAQSFINHFASHVITSCGPWIFDHFDESVIRFRRNPEFYDPIHALYSNLEISFLETQEAIWRDFLATKSDLCLLAPDNLIDLEQYLHSSEYRAREKSGLKIERKEYLQRQYSYIGWNEKRPLFSSKKVRKALTLAIDRSRIIREALHGQAVEVTGPFFYDSQAYNRELLPYPYDPERAKRLLAEEGWFDSDGDGIIDNEIDGKRVAFQFHLSYFIKNMAAKICCEMIARNLKEVGIDCQLNGLDIPDISQGFDDKSFDAVFLTWVLSTPPEDPRQLWHSEGAKIKGSSNMIGFENKEVDQLIESLQYEDDPKKRQELYFKLHDILYDEQPYTFLFTPKATLVWWNFIENIFIPNERQDLIPGATVDEPVVLYSWKRETV